MSTPGKGPAQQPRRTVRTPQKPFYRAKKPLRTAGRNGKPKAYKIGQIVPEAKTWPRVEAWVRSGHLELVE